MNYLQDSDKKENIVIALMYYILKNCYILRKIALKYYTSDSTLFIF